MPTFSQDHLHEMCRFGLDRFTSTNGIYSLPLSYEASLHELLDIAIGNLIAGRLERQNGFRASGKALTIPDYIDRVIATWVEERPHWRSLQAGEPDAWERLNRDLLPAAKRLIHRRPVSGSAASTPEDFVQLACLRIARAEYRFDIPLSVWMRAILKNTIREPDRSRDALDLWHFSLDTPLPGNGDESGVVSEFADSKAELGFDRIHEREALLHALDHLAVLRHAILVLTFFEERTDAEITKILDISLTHLHSTRHRALKQLAGLLEKH
jgi:RNA polymerase sigma factor (sigma-70 family)